MERRSFLDYFLVILLTVIVVFCLFFLLDRLVQYHVENRINEIATEVLKKITIK